jgi:IS30 family transposase
MANIAQSLDAVPSTIDGGMRRSFIIYNAYTAKVLDRAQVPDRVQVMDRAQVLDRAPVLDQVLLV